MSKTALEWRQMGNVFFKQRYYPKALDCYTESVLMASRTSSMEDLSLAYANRSAAMFYLNEFKICLQDIELALDHGYPNEMLYKLYQRKGLCLMNLGLVQDAVLALQDAMDEIKEQTTHSQQKRSCLEKELQKHLQSCKQRNLVSSSKENSMKNEDQFVECELIANASQGVSLKYDETKGRHLVAKSDISAGSVVIQELPYASVLLPDHNQSHCHFCHRRLVAPIPCAKCVWALYCSKPCLQSAREEHHLMECPHRKLLLQLGTFAWLSLRLLLHAKKEKADSETMCELKDTSELRVAGCEPDGSYKAAYNAVCSLMPHTSNHTQQELDSYQQKAECLVRCFGHHLLSQDVKSSKEMLAQDINSKLSNLAVGSQTDSHTNNAKAIDSVDSKGVASCDETTQDSATDITVDSQKKNFADLKKAFDSVDQQISIRSLNETTHVDKNTDHSTFAADSQKENQANSDKAFDSIDQKNSKTNHLIGTFILHMKQLKCNAHAITAVEPVQEDKNVSYDNSRGRLSEMVTTTEQVRLATAVYPTASLMNHSCVPNVIASFHGRQLVVRAIRTIKAGEEILHCYGPYAKHMDTTARRQALQEQYFFTCNCTACESNTDDSTSDEACDWSKAYRCPNCEGPIEVLGNGHQKCGKCGEDINDQVLKQQEVKATRLFSQALEFLHGSDFEGCISALRPCYEIRTKVLYKYHKDMAETQDCMARCYASLGKFSEAGDHLASSLVIIEKIFGEDSIEVAHELHKLAQIYFNGKEVEKARDVIDKALRLFILHYGSTHELVEELSQMKQCLMEL
ncbi:SET and MYND domain-containing protein 4-like [Amphiura filiformis]|uniref:SET and MYND domain-containing protein 4-like n=1 Tax=Amphiura filiformis TaxID=82378 RepID=UPI003B227801